ncbi:DNA-binding protein HU-beta [Defluviimonas denitrificans]|jgi:nucleoid DNA-binding protein|uniref:DNA-binding protein HU-beta n=1 Tax=Albidovulum denitrificans TaxID=404881 RepID=A0A2S8S6D5_9RHOB|nr:HU family DNA-binding protein [Defluviimonas denitrificans]PQV56379.1 DNA-binding protein HU-beta [Defluviimonas denitrificans]
MKTAGKSDLASSVMLAAGLNSHAQAMDAVDATVAAIRALTEAGTPVTIKGFGRFEMRDRSARNGRNPATGEAIQIPASRHLAFKAAKS